MTQRVASGNALSLVTSMSLVPRVQCLFLLGRPTKEDVQQKHTSAIADLQKMAVAEWLQSFNSVRGPMESLEIVRVPYTVSSCSSAHWKRTSGSQEI